MSEYWKKLKDPRWQRRRLDVLSGADFTCQNCDASDKTLHVHHMYYERGANPWEYPDEAYRALCEDCHEIFTQKQLDLARVVARLDLRAIESLIGTAKGHASVQGIGQQLTEQTQVEAFASFYKITPDELLKFRNPDGWVNADAIYDYAVLGKGKEAT